MENTPAYSGPFVITNNSIVIAQAFKAGLDPSGLAAAAFLFTTGEFSFSTGSPPKNNLYLFED